MYKIEKASFEDFLEMAGKATEAGKPDARSFKGAFISKLICESGVVALAAYKDIVMDDGSEVRAVACIFRNDIKDHLMTIVRAGKQYLSIIGDKPMLALADNNNKTFQRFLEFWEFEDTSQLETLEETGKIYRIYVRE